MTGRRRSHRNMNRAATTMFGTRVVFLCAFVLGITTISYAQNPIVRAIVYDSNQTGRYEIYLKNLDINNVAVGSPLQLTNAGAAQQEAQEPQYSLVASTNATVNPDYLGRIVYQFGTSGVRGLHLIKPLPYGSNTDVQLTPQPLNGIITGGPLKGQPYPCADARDPFWSPDGLHIVYACLEPLLSGIGSSYDLWIHDTNGTPDNPKDDADYPLLVLNGPLALQPAWSPDGTMIAYMTNARWGASTAPTPKIGLLSVPAQLGTVIYSPTVLTGDAFNDIEPAWDPSSSFIAFSSTRKLASDGSFTSSSNRTIWIVTSDGQAIFPLTGTSNSTANDSHPVWTSDNLVAFQSDFSNGNAIWVIDARTPEFLGGVATQITSGGGGDPAPGTPLKGIDIDYRAGLIADWTPMTAPSNGPPVSVVAVDLYGGVDGANNPGCNPYLNNPNPGTSAAPDCTANSDSVNNLISAQNVPSFFTAAYVLLSFTAKSGTVQYETNSAPGVGYGKHAVDYAYAAVGSVAWNKLSFVAIDVEGASATDTQWGTMCDHFREVVGAIVEVTAKSAPNVNIVVYSSPGDWNALLGTWTDPKVLVAACPTISSSDITTVMSRSLWEATDDKIPNLTTTNNLPFGFWTKANRVGNQYNLEPVYLYGVPGVNDCGPNGVAPCGPGGLDYDIFDPSILAPPGGSTGVGANLGTVVVNTTTGIASLAVTFSNATQAGVTTATSSSSGPPPPSGYRPVTPQTYYDVTTTALYTGPVQVCLNYTGISYATQAALALFHYVSNAWTNVTSSSNPASNTICGSVTSLSPFAIFEQGTLATPVLTVTGGTFAYDGAAHGATGSATGVSGSPVSGSFTLTYMPGGSSPPVNVGTYVVTAQFTSADPNYTNGSSTGTITIIPAPVQTPTTTPTGRMQFARVSHQATLLSSGLVLVSGGQNGGTAVVQSELYNPATGTWSLTGSNIIPRFDHTATLLSDGRVLAVGGVSSTGDCTSNVTAETYDPAKGTWSLTARLPSPVGTGHIAVLLLDGRVLVSGGGDRCGTVFNAAAIFDPSTNRWSATGNMTGPREFHSAALLSDGRVLVAGGATSSPFPIVASAEIYDPKTGVWTAVSSMGTARQTSCNGYAQPYLASLSGGTVLAAGGFSGPNCSSITPQRTVSSLTVSPSPALLSNVGQTLSLTVSAQMSDASTQLFTGPLQFASADTTVARVDSNGLITSVGTGTTTITITASGITPLNVATTVAARNLSSIAVSPSPITLIGPGQTQSLAVNGQYSDGSQQALTTGVTFTSSNTAVATVGATGLVTSVANGTATITATAQGTPAVQVSCTVKSLVSIGVSPTTITLTTLGQVQPLTVTGLFSDGSQQILTGTVSFVSSNPSVARVDLSGNVTALANGTATITVSVAAVAAVQVPVTIAPKPILLSTNPNTALQGQQSLSVTLTGQFTNWVQGTTTATFGAGITVTALTINSPTTATASLNIDPAAKSGPRTITLTTGTEIDTLANGFTIVAQTAVLVSVNPPTGQLGQQNLSVSLTGQFTNWVQGTTAANFGAGITISSLTVNSPTSATAVLTIDPATTIGPRTVTMTTGSEVATLVNGFAISGGPMEVDAKPFSVMNLAGVTGGQPIQLETDAKTFSVLNTSGAGSTGGRQSSEADAAEFSVLNMAGVTGGQPVSMEVDAVPFSVLNTAGPGGSGGSLTLFEVDALVFSTLNLAGMTGNQPVQMEVDGVPFSVQNGPGPVAQAVPNKSAPGKQVTQAKAITKDAGTSIAAAQDSGGTNKSSSIEKDKQ